MKRPANPSRHERAHEAAARRLGVAHRWVDRGGEAVVESSVWSSKRGSRQAAIIQAAGALAGGGDSGADMRNAEELAAEAGVSMDEVLREARRCL